MRKASLQATGVPDLEYEVIATGRWELKAQIAETFAVPFDDNPRIFLLGDAAHNLPPTRGGYGVNTGTGDAHNLAWKLGSVLNGYSSPALLTSYNSERRPMAVFRHNQTSVGPDYAEFRAPGVDYGALQDGLAVELAQVYESAVVVGGYRSIDGVRSIKPGEHGGVPGVRAPHFWLLKDGKERVSNLALFGKDFTVVTVEPAWKGVVEKASRNVSRRIDLTVLAGVGGVEMVQFGKKSRGMFPDISASRKALPVSYGRIVLSLGEVVLGLWIWIRMAKRWAKCQRKL